MTSKLDRISELTSLVVGDVMIDAYLWGNVERQSPEAPVPVVLKTGKDSRIGGAGNVARNVIAMGAKVHLASVIGNDISGKYLHQLLEEKGIGTSSVISENERTTTVKTRIIKGTEHMLRVDEETTSPISEESLEELKSSITRLLDSQKIDVVIIEDYNKGVMRSDLIDFILDIASSKGIVVSVDPKLQNFKAYKGVDLFKPNLKELREGLNLEINPESSEELKQAVETLHSEIAPKISLTTLGGHGMWLHSETNPHHHEVGISRDVVDVSGAGDTVIAVASLMLASGASHEEIVKAANIAGGQVCEKSGVVMVNVDELAAEFES